MPGSFTTPTISATIAEGGSLTVTITPSSALGAATTVRWVIVPKGKAPISSSDFSSLTGTLSFTSGSSTAHTLTLTPTNDTALEVGETFELQLYEVVSGSDDIELATGMVTISDNDTGSFGSRDRIGSGAKNVLGAASSEGADYNGAAGNDVFVLDLSVNGAGKYDVVTDFTSGDKIRVDTANGSEASVAAVKSAAKLSIVNNANYNTGETTNNSGAFDTVITYLGADGVTGGTGDNADYVVMVLEDYSTALSITNFDIV